jgi:FixJ family two-component response regulator
VADVPEASPIVFVIDDDAGVRSAIQRLLGSIGLAVHAFSSAAAFKRRRAVGGPACMLLLGLPGLSGLEFQRYLAEQEPSLPIVFISGDNNIPMSVLAMKAGAVEFLPKPVREQALIDAVREGLARAQLERRAASALTGLRDRYGALTPRERQVMQRVVDGRLNRQIAFELGISEGTVKVHRGQVMQKMGATSVPDLVRMAGHMGIESAPA